MSGEKQMSRLSLRPIRPGELETLIAKAGRDNHTVIDPTHVALKDGQIVGYCSLSHRVSLVNLWLSSTEAGAIDSLTGLTAVESLCAEHGSAGIVMPCSENSPFYKKMGKLGFRTLGTSSVNVKGI